MSKNYETRIASAVKILEQYFSETERTLKKVLLDMGIDNSEIGIETLESPTTSFEDFQESVVNCKISTLIPKPRLKLAWEALSKVSMSDVSIKTTANSSIANMSDFIKTMRPAGQWSDLELLEAYDKEVQKDVEKALINRSKSRCCIVFYEDGSVDTEKSLYMIRKAKYQETSPTFIFGGETKQIYKVGEFPLKL